MEIDKQQIVSLLRERGDSDQADRAEQELPDQVDAERDRNLLERFGIDPSELLSRFTGGREIPGL
ncbi:MAG TPA: hypothetical protein VHF67_00365 [Gaiellaceae bacterium]|nr:hypothetical protein [Gaiellaceae bacterium]